MATAAALVSVVLWASAFVGIRAAGHHFSPGSLAAARLVIGAGVLGLVVAVRREPLPKPRDAPLIALCGLLWFALYNLALNAGERYVDAGTASMIIRVAPILIAVLAGLVLAEGFSRRIFAGGGIAIAGTAVIGIASSGGRASAAGVLLCLLAAAAFASGVVVEKLVLRRVSALQTVFWCCVVGAIVCSPFLPSFGHQAASAPVDSIVWLAYLGVGPTALGFTAWAYALARTEAARLGALTYLGPPISIALGWAMLDESPPALALVGGATCLAGVAIARQRP